MASTGSRRLTLKAIPYTAIRDPRTTRFEGQFAQKNQAKLIAVRPLLLDFPGAVQIVQYAA